MRNLKLSGTSSWNPHSIDQSFVDNQSEHENGKRGRGRKPVKNSMADVLKRLEALEHDLREHDSLKGYVTQLKVEKDELQSRVAELEKELCQLKTMVNTTTPPGALS